MGPFQANVEFTSLWAEPIVSKDEPFSTNWCNVLLNWPFDRSRPLIWEAEENAFCVFLVLRGWRYCPCAFG
jgi:hypothetical protein